MEKLIYKTKEYTSKANLMTDNNLTADQYDSLLSMGRIQMVDNDDFSDFAGVWLGANRNSNNENKDNDEG